jgi:hypothetical protein
MDDINSERARVIPDDDQPNKRRRIKVKQLYPSEKDVEPEQGRKRKIESSNGQSTTIKFYRASWRGCEPHRISHKFHSRIIWYCTTFPHHIFPQQQTSKYFGTRGRFQVG